MVRILLFLSKCLLELNVSKFNREDNKVRHSFVKIMQNREFKVSSNHRWNCFLKVESKIEVHDSANFKLLMCAVLLMTVF